MVPSSPSGPKKGKENLPCRQRNNQTILYLVKKRKNIRTERKKQMISSGGVCGED